LLCLLLSKNINIRADVEDQLINFYNQCLVLDRGRGSVNKVEPSKKPSIYPYVSARVILRLKACLFEARKRIFENKLALNWDSLNNSLVNQSALEHNLENILQVIILETGYSKEELVYRLANKLYTKLRCRVRDSHIDFKDLESDVVLFSFRLSVLHNIEPEADEFIKMDYISWTVCLAFPTKIER
jgi:hypothetical protein